MPDQTYTSLTKTDGGRLFTTFTMLFGALLLWLVLAVPLNAQIPGLQFPAGSEASDQKPGSILFYNYITSSAASPITQNTVISLTNTSTTTAVTVRLIFVNGTTGANLNAFINLAPVQTAQFLASDIVPGLTGYLMAVAVDSNTLCPINFNHLIGDANIKRASGHRAGLSAIAIAAIAANPAACAGATTAINFDGVNYNRIPRTLALDSVPSRADGNDTLFVLNRVGGNLTGGGSATTIGTLSGLLFNDVAQGLNFTQTASTPQFVASLTNSFPSTSPLFETFISSGKTGFMRFFNNTDSGYFGAALNFNPNVNNASFNTGNNFTHRTVTATQTVTVPVGAPDLIVAKTHSGNFTIGSTGVYTITVTNNSNTAMSALFNTILVSDSLPGNLTLASFSGAGWSCTGVNSNNVNCQITTTLGANASAAPLTLTVNVGGGTPTGTNSITNTVQIQTLQEFNFDNNSASDPTTVTAANDPCSTFLPIAYGQTLNGVLQAGDCTTIFGDGSFTDLYTFSGTAGDQIAIALNSSAFDAYLALFNPSGVSIAQDNNGGGGTNARIPAGSGFFTLPVTGAYFIAANTFVPSGSGAYSLTLTRLTCPTITVTPASLPAGASFTAYSQTLSAGGGALPYTFAVSAGALPAGLTLTTGGLLSGAPTVSGPFNFTVRATDINGCTGQTAYMLTIAANPGLQFYPLPSPVRLLDTRSGVTGCVTNVGELAANSTRTQAARTPCSTIPANATAIIGSITVVPSGPGFLTLFPSDATQPTVANSNFNTGEVTNNFFTVGLGADGAFKIFTSASTQVIIDLTGYYAPPSPSGLYYHPLPAPVRLVQTFPGQTGCFANGSQQLQGTNNPNANPALDLTVDGRGAGLPSPCNSIPGDAVVLVGNATTVFPSAPFGFGYLTIYPSDAARPTVASSNYGNGDIINGPFAVKLGADGKFKVYTFSTTHLVIDISGYYSASATDANGAGLLFNPLPKPMRLLETRNIPGFPLTGCYKPQLPIQGGVGGIRTQQVWGMCSDQPITIPNTARAIVGNVTAINPVAAGFGTFFPGNVGTAPTVATTNYPFPVTFGYNRHYYVGLGPSDGTFKILTQFTSDYIVDVSGYFAP